jgi:hypothetical protein
MRVAECKIPEAEKIEREMGRVSGVEGGIGNAAAGPQGLRPGGKVE